MTLKPDILDQRILFELEKNARIPDTQLAKIVHKSKDTVRYRISNLEKEGVIERYKTWIDSSKLGFLSATLYLTVKNIPGLKEEIIASISSDQETYWLGVAHGVWDIAVSYFYKTNEELFTKKQNLLDKFGEGIINITTTNVVGVYTHEKNFLYAEANTSIIKFSEKVKIESLDELDRKILSTIYWDARMPIVSISQKVKTAASVVIFRLKKLKEKGIIIRYTAVIDYRKIGYEYYKTFIYLQKCTKLNLRSILEFCSHSNKIINTVVQIAPWDLEMVVFAKNFSEYEETITDFTKRFSKITKKIETAIMGTDIIYPCSRLPF